MTDYKFRIWHKGIKNKHQSVTSQMIYDEQPGDCFKWAREGQTAHPVMQGISRKDNNGKDIYEGDVLRITNDNANTTIISDIKFLHSSFCVKDCYGEYYPMFSLARPGDVLEILGNIYANPELIP